MRIKICPYCNKQMNFQNLGNTINYSCPECKTFFYFIINIQSKKYDLYCTVMEVSVDNKEYSIILYEDCTKIYDFKSYKNYNIDSRLNITPLNIKNIIKLYLYYS